MLARKNESAFLCDVKSQSELTTIVYVNDEVILIGGLP